MLLRTTATERSEGTKQRTSLLKKAFLGMCAMLFLGGLQAGKDEEMREEERAAGAAVPQITLPVTALTGFTRLCLERCGLTDLSDEVGQLEALQQLILRYNRLTALPETLKELPCLQKLDISHNAFTDAPRVISDLRALHVLLARNNQLTHVPSVWGALSRLCELDLSQNELEEVPAAWHTLTALTSISLAHNRLQDMPAEWSALTALRMIFLAYNRLRTLPTTWADMETLITVDLDQNPLESLSLRAGSARHPLDLRLGDTLDLKRLSIFSPHALSQVDLSVEKVDFLAELAHKPLPARLDKKWSVSSQTGYFKRGVWYTTASGGTDVKLCLVAKGTAPLALVFGSSPGPTCTAAGSAQKATEREDGAACTKAPCEEVWAKAYNAALKRDIKRKAKGCREWAVQRAAAHEASNPTIVDPRREIYVHFAAQEQGAAPAKACVFDPTEQPTRSAMKVTHWFRGRASDIRKAKRRRAARKAWLRRTARDEEGRVA